jgi:uracil-DNA glycosylase
VPVAKRARGDEPHLAPLNAVAAAVEAEVGLPVPRFDPDSGGVDARVLLLLETPSRAGTFGSGLISIDNDDTAAANLWRAHADTGLPRTWSLVWNAVPWYVGSAERIRPVLPAEIRRAAPWLRDVVGLLPRLRALIVLGRAAQRALPGLRGLLDRRQILVLEAPHPSQRVYNAPGQRARERIHAAFRTAAVHAATSAPEDPDR